MNNGSTLSFEKLFLALADKTRLRLLNLIGEREVSVSIFVTVLDESQPKISRHLAYLRNSGLVKTKRKGKRIKYCITEFEDRIIADILQHILQNLKLTKEFQDDLERFEKLNDFERIKETVIYVQPDMYYSRDEREELETFLL